MIKTLTLWGNQQTYLSDQQHKTCDRLVFDDKMASVASDNKWKKAADNNNRICKEKGLGQEVDKGRLIFELECFGTVVDRYAVG